jgi:hypothetical protein
MADITITASNVLAASAASTGSIVSGTSTLTAGMAVYRDTSDSNQYKACDANASGTASCDGLMLNSADDGQPSKVITDGTLTVGAGVTVGEVYCVSPNPGRICPHSDLASGEYVTVIGVGLTATTIKVDIINSGVAKPYTW